MKKLKFILLAALLTAVPGGFAGASDPRGIHENYGQGLDSCATVLEEYRKDTLRYTSFKIWVAGFMTAAGIYHDTQKVFGEDADIDAIMHLIRRHCDENPLDKLAIAAQVVTLELLDRAGRR